MAMPKPNFSAVLLLLGSESILIAKEEMSYIHRPFSSRGRLVSEGTLFFLILANGSPLSPDYYYGCAGFRSGANTR
jgi:hypothetical protein